MKARLILVAAAALAAVSVEPDPARWSAETGVLAQAQALVGRPRTPASFAGVARRTTRRTVRRTTAYVATLPRGCATVIVNGAQYYQCGGTYYQAHGGQYVVVHIN